MNKFNKFLEKYPELWEPKVGDIVQVVYVLDCNGFLVKNTWNYAIGETGKIVAVPTITGGFGLYTVRFDKSKAHLLYREEFELSDQYHAN
jgi:hypothetical protein